MAVNKYGVDVVTEEEPTVDPEPVEEEEELGGFEDLEKFFIDEDEEVEEEEQEEPEEEPEEETAEDVALQETVEEAQQQERLFTQTELNQIIGNARIQGRDLTDKVEMLSHMTNGMNLDQIIDHLRSQQAEQYENEYGLPREQAERFVEESTENRLLKTELNKLHSQQQIIANMTAYNTEKAKCLAQYPLAKKYEAEIDAMSQGGKMLGFEAAMTYVVGKKSLTGEVQKNVREVAQQKAIKDESRKPRVTPEGAGSGGAPSNSIPPDLRKMAQLFGNDPKSVARQYQKIQRTQR